MLAPVGRFMRPAEVAAPSVLAPSGLGEMNCGTCGQKLPKAKRRWEIFLPLEPPSQNRVAQNKGSGRHRYKQFRDDFELLLRAAKRAKRIPTAKRKRRVWVERLYSGRGQPRDKGNIVGGCKPLLDAMTKVGLLVDDREEFCEDHYGQERANESGVFIVLEEL